MEASHFHRIAKALADPTRFEILEIIAATDELVCGEIKECFVIAQPTVSHHLKELANAGLVVSRRQGQYIHYRVQRDVLAQYIEELQRRTRTQVAAPLPTAAMVDTANRS